jgi:type VI protein secretion system component Hcp
MRRQTRDTPVNTPFTRPAMIVRSLALVATLLFASGSATALDAVLYLDNIVGNNTTPGRAGSIVVEAYSFSNVRTSIVGQASLSPLSVIKQVGPSTPYLLFANANGSVFPQGRLEVFGSNPASPIFKIAMTDIRIMTVAAAAGLSGERESVSLQFEEITWTYYNGAEEIEQCWDAFAGTSC